MSASRDLVHVPRLVPCAPSVPSDPPQPWSCPGCATSRAHDRTTCFWCGSRLPVGRVASAQEAYETSQEAREERCLRSAQTRRRPEEVEAEVLHAIRALGDADAPFTHDQLCAYTPLAVTAIIRAIDRLAAKGAVIADGEVKIRPGRFRTRWRTAWPPTPGAASAASAASAPEAGGDIAAAENGAGSADASTRDASALAACRGEGSAEQGAWGAPAATDDRLLTP
jgi:hypothetical protein